MSDLLDRLDREVEAWKPEPGDKLVGTVESIEMFAGKHAAQYGEYPLLIVSTEDGEVGVHAFHTVLRNELARKKPENGDQIGLKYLGKNNEGGYEAYRVVLERRTPVDAEVDWDRIRDEAKAEAEAADVPPPGSIREAVTASQPDEAPF